MSERTATPLHVRLDKTERSAVEAAAKAEGLTVSAFVRRAILAAARKVAR